MEHLLIDSTVIRAHPCAAGASKKKGGQAEQALGRGRGGFSTKIHVNVDALGNPVRFTLTGGQRHDITQADVLIAGYKGEYVIADKSYDADAFRQVVKASGAPANAFKKGTNERCVVSGPWRRTTSHRCRLMCRGWHVLAVRPNPITKEIEA